MKQSRKPPSNTELAEWLGREAENSSGCWSALFAELRAARFSGRKKRPTFSRKVDNCDANIWLDNRYGTVSPHCAADTP